MKKILGLDLGTTSIGWAFVHEAENNNETSKIIKTGVRVVPLSTDEQQDFEKGNSITLNADRTLKRSARRNLQRFKLRRSSLLDILKANDFINNNNLLSENGKDTTHQLYEIRAKAATQKISKEDFARVLLSINKKRGYKSSRKAKGTDEGSLIDGMAIAKELANKKITPGEYSLVLLQTGKKKLPDYYKSDLQDEFDLIWNFQKQFYPILNKHHYQQLLGKNRTVTKQYFEKEFLTELAENKGKDKKIQLYTWRAISIKEKLDLDIVTLILTEVNNQINNSSSYLAAISDRSKELYFQNKTVGQYQFEQLKDSPNNSLKNQVFYRQDYIEEFNTIWDTQSQFYPELTDDLKKKISDTILFYQRRLRSQKGLVSICELEKHLKTITVDGKTSKKLIGPKVAPRSSPIFQIVKTWQSVNTLRLVNEITNEEITLDDELRQLIFDKLQIQDHLKPTEILRLLKSETDIDTKVWKCNLEQVEGNKTQAKFISAFLEIIYNEGINELSKNTNHQNIIDFVTHHFKDFNINTDILTLDHSILGNDFTEQPAYQLWHLLYSFEGDNSNTGDKKLIEKLGTKFGFNEEQAKILASISFEDNYGKLSVKALRKLYPHLVDGFVYSEAAEKAGYNHSKSLTKEENEARLLKKSIEILPKNALRNPVVEKIINQMIHVVNQIISHPEMGTPDEIRVEMTRELKNNAKVRKELSSSIKKATAQNQKDREYLQKEIGLKHVSRKDLVKYKLYKELKSIGYKSLYSGTYIELNDLFFTNKFDVEHIIPQSLFFDDSFSNKTLELRSVNLEKGNQTAIDYCVQKGWETNFKNRILELRKSNSIGYSKYQKLLRPKEEIGGDFVNRDLNNTAYISKKATEILLQVSRHVLTTNGKITDRLRNDWGLIDVLKELNWEKYNQLGLTYTVTNKENKELKRIKDWTKRNDHRHHAMDAIAVAFSRREYIQYLNNLNAKHVNNDNTKDVIGIEKKFLFRNKHNKLIFRTPFPTLRKDSLDQLSKLIISFKAKNKVVTRNINKTKIKNGVLKKIELTPRGQLHKETIYGRSLKQEITFEKIDGKFNKDKIDTVTNTFYRESLLERLEQFGNDPKKAFTGKNSIRKNPIKINNGVKTLPEKVKCLTVIEQFTIRKPITPDLKVDKVIDKGIQRILKNRLNEFGGDPKKAFVNLDDHPIWYDQKKEKAIKRVKIEGVSNTIALHEAKDQQGNLITDKEGNHIPNDFVSTSNNHHVAIYEDVDGNLSDEIVSFYEAVVRKQKGFEIINKNDTLGNTLKFSLKQNEMFVLLDENFNIDQLNNSTTVNQEISNRLFRVQTISRVSYGNSVVRDYVFRHHLDTTTNKDAVLKGITWIALKSLSKLSCFEKIRINHLGEIVHIGEY